MSFSPTFYPNAPVHTLKDFEPVGIVASAPIVIVGSKEIPGNTLKEFMASAKKKAKLSNGNAGAGTTSHLACVMLNARFGRRSRDRALQELGRRGGGHADRHHRLCLRPVDQRDGPGHAPARSSRWRCWRRRPRRPCRACRPSRRPAIRAPRWWCGTRCLRRRARRARSSAQINAAIGKGITDPAALERFQSSAPSRRPPPTARPRRWPRSTPPTSRNGAR